MFRLALSIFVLTLLTGCGGGGSNDNDGASGRTSLTNSPPVITLSGSSRIVLTYGTAYKEPGATAEDNEDGDISDQIVIGGDEVDPFSPATYIVTYSVEDSAGASDKRSREVVVNDNSAPVISLKGSRRVVIPVGSDYEDAGATAEDPEDGDLTGQLVSTSNVDTSAPGHYWVRYSARDSGGVESTRERTVLVGHGGVQSDDITARLRSLTRTEAVSPETIYFSAQESTDAACSDLSGGSDSEACATGQWFRYHFDFDDPDSGNFSTTGISRNSQVGPSPRALHTFTCKPESSNYQDGACEYRVGVRVQSPDQAYGEDFITIRVLAQESAYAAEDVICVSPTSNFSGCPQGASRHVSVPQPGEFSGKRVLLHAGERFGDICIGYQERDVTVASYGDGKRPVVPLVQVGVVDRCLDVPRTEDARSYPMLAKDAQGHITQGWAYGITVTGLKVGRAITGTSATLVTMHDLDMDWSETGEFPGFFAFGDSTNYCMNNPNELDCDQVPLSYGIFFTDSVQRARSDNLPNVNIGCMNNCLMVNGGIAGVDTKTAIEHNARFMGAWGLVVSNVWFRGNHIGQRGGKHRLTLRQSDAFDRVDISKDPEDFSLRANYTRPRTLSGHFTPHFNFVFDSIFNDTEMDPQHDSASFTELESGHLYSGFFNNEYLLDQVDQNQAQMRLGGVNIMATDNVFNSVNMECILDSDHPDGSALQDNDRIFTDVAGCGATIGRDYAIPLKPGT
ncbi:DUF5011 domain-containing protein [Microbulbifer sediminum]|uniref:DUF5011 domain-containing protein n=1 Tax=Microbulbifer sediminum TaxID=2904250 RepID=UPI00210481A2|nr:DUF5011 domain-containing protein [Microbulbifer sediminum]